MRRVRAAWLAAGLLLLAGGAAAVALAVRGHGSCGHGESSMAVRVDHGRTTVIRPAHRTGC